MLPANQWQYRTSIEAWTSSLEPMEHAIGFRESVRVVGSEVCFGIPKLGSRTVAVISLLQPAGVSALDRHAPIRECENCQFQGLFAVPESVC